MDPEIAERRTHYEQAVQREWLVTNGIGGYAMGTVAGPLTRRYHGLLIATLQPPVDRRLLLTRLDETIRYRGKDHTLFTNEWADGLVEPDGWTYLQSFELVDGIPTWRYAVQDALIQKQIWMAQGQNTSYIRYELLRADHSVSITAKLFGNQRDHHATTQSTDLTPTAAMGETGLRISFAEHDAIYYLLAARGEFKSVMAWHQGYLLRQERYRGFDTDDEHVHLADYRAELSPGESLTLVASTDPLPELDGDTALQAKLQHANRLINLADAGCAEPIDDPLWTQLVLAADQFVIERPLTGADTGHSIVAGYPWFGDWGRDTMISLPGLTLATGRPEVAKSILGTYADFVDQGMLPNRFPDAGEAPEYNTIDASLWYFEAVRAYVEYMLPGGSLDLRWLARIFEVLESIATWHLRGTRYNIKVDADGLLSGGEPQVQLTWMDAKVDDWVVTPRLGKPVEISALWYNALQTMARLADVLGRPTAGWLAEAERTALGFQRFWNESRGCCFDVLDGPEGDDPTLRPNQIMAVSLAYSPLSSEKQRAIVDVCAEHLYTPHGLRSLAAGEAAYTGIYGGDRHARDAAYHQGTTWGWLMGPFAEAHLKIYQDPAQTWSMVAPLARQVSSHGLGSISEIFDGDRPFLPRGCPAQAWSVAEVIRLWTLTKPELI
jgi:predicted glycogen debranching enzyme